MPRTSSDEPKRLGIRIERCARIELKDDQLWKAAARALAEAQANLNTAELGADRRMNKREVLKLSAALAAKSWGAVDLAGEAPLDPLHEEPSDWKRLADSSGKIPWLVFAADVLDFVASSMGEHDVLIMENS